MKHVGIEIKFYNLDTFKKQIGVNFIDLDSELVDLNGKVASLIFCHVWRSIITNWKCDNNQILLTTVSDTSYAKGSLRDQNHLSTKIGHRINTEIFSQVQVKNNTTAYQHCR